MQTAWVVTCGRGCWEAHPTRAVARSRKLVLNALWNHTMAQIQQFGTVTLGTSECAEKHRIAQCREAA